MDSQFPSERHIEPVGLFHENGFWYVLGYCHLRNDYRNFRTDRMVLIQRTAHSFALEHGSLDEHREKRDAFQKTKVRILVDKSVAGYLKGNRNHYGFVSEKTVGNAIEMTFMTMSMEGFARWFLMFGDYAEIVEPESLKFRIKEILKKAEERL